MMEEYRNKVFNEDVIEVLKRIPDNSLDMVYGDPDYNVGINYAGKHYTQKWNDYIEWYIELTKQSMRVFETLRKFIHDELSKAKRVLEGEVFR